METILETKRYSALGGLDCGACGLLLCWGSMLLPPMTSAMTESTIAPVSCLVMSTDLLLLVCPILGGLGLLLPAGSGDTDLPWRGMRKCRCLSS